MTPVFQAQHDGIRAALEVSIERHPGQDSLTGDLSEADAAWPKRLRRIVRASLTYWRRPDLIETAELLLSELATNALRHGHGHDITVRVFFHDGCCVIEVNDGSSARPALRRASPTDEGGRGLILVDALAESWGVSDDGATTWCTLPLNKGSEEMQPVAVTAPVLREIPLDLPADPSATGLARIQARTLLTVLSWPGNQHLAIDVLHVLLDNAVRHALPVAKTVQTFGVRLSVTEAHELLVDVTDPVPAFPNFDKAVAGEVGRGLWEAVRQGAELSWFVVGSDYGAKTVRAVLRPGRVDR
ncbi:ATP-binding protein [Streptomyces sp. NPDC127190]|uniref:ATP-binding protein n=1 Tax=unclassified Streptomyces TaxID=2593676 RepID=UPI00362E9716